MADEYVPTTEQVRETYAALCKTEAAADEFDRWLAEHDRESAEKAWDEGYDYASDGKWGPGENPYRDGGADRG